MTVFVRSGTDRNDAPMLDLADVEFKLDGGVMDLEALTEHGANCYQNAGAGGGRHVGNGHVAGERMGVAADAPHMQIVHGIRRRGSRRSLFRCGPDRVPLGVPSSRMFRLSRMMPIDDHRIITPMPTDSAGSIQCCPVKAIATAPAITAAVDKVSPIRGAAARCAG